MSQHPPTDGQSGLSQSCHRNATVSSCMGCSTHVTVRSEVSSGLIWRHSQLAPWEPCQLTPKASQHRTRRLPSSPGGKVSFQRHSSREDIMRVLSFSSLPISIRALLSFLLICRSSSYIMEMRLFLSRKLQIFSQGFSFAFFDFAYGGFCHAHGFYFYVVKLTSLFLILSGLCAILRPFPL